MFNIEVFCPDTDNLLCVETPVMGLPLGAQSFLLYPRGRPRLRNCLNQFMARDYAQISAI